MGVASAARVLSLAHHMCSVTDFCYRILKESILGDLYTNQRMYHRDLRLLKKLGFHTEWDTGSNSYHNSSMAQMFYRGPDLGPDLSVEVACWAYRNARLTPSPESLTAAYAASKIASDYYHLWVPEVRKLYNMDSVFSNPRTSNEEYVSRIFTAVHYISGNGPVPVDELRALLLMANYKDGHARVVPFLETIPLIGWGYQTADECVDMCVDEGLVDCNAVGRIEGPARLTADEKHCFRVMAALEQHKVNKDRYLAVIDEVTKT